MKNSDFSNRGERLKEERKRLGIGTQDELAEILNVKKNSVVRYEKHNAALDTDQLDLLEDHGFNIPYILWGTIDVNTSDLEENESKLIQLYRQTREEMRPGLVSIVETYANQFK
ncbi:transcriptional regulator [Acinetobacter pittii]|uniref:helix-turn-helix domain-containing protein n=1 Tax=Acinetobacter calcoaceticus/baumannii complex TaxID=909768 RepID=UPI00044A52B3|nr:MULTISPECIES: helix-turn-helix transcriptional regulator [Acinetobacter calcoaceticus/baumannii complex]EXG33061.1 helix-turn-helix domain protein [Acinetobacter sp. 263903-2]OTS02607.1 transcriptional regulator [Acinetobacter pittii]